MNDEPETCTNCENPLFDESEIVYDADGYPYCDDECRDEYLADEEEPERTILTPVFRNPNSPTGWAMTDENGHIVVFTPR